MGAVFGRSLNGVGTICTVCLAVSGSTAGDHAPEVQPLPAGPREPRCAWCAGACCASGGAAKWSRGGRADAILHHRSATAKHCCFTAHHGSLGCLHRLKAFPVLGRAPDCLCSVLYRAGLGTFPCSPTLAPVSGRSRPCPAPAPADHAYPGSRRSLMHACLVHAEGGGCGVLLLVRSTHLALIREMRVFVGLPLYLDCHGR